MFKKSKFFQKFVEIICPCCKINKLYCLEINDKSLIIVETFTCNTCNLLVSFFTGNVLDYYVDLDYYFASDKDYILFNHRYHYIKRILNSYVKKW